MLTRNSHLLSSTNIQKSKHKHKTCNHDGSAVKNAFALPLSQKGK